MRMADRAHLGIDLEATLRGRQVERAEEPVEAPVLRRRCRRSSCAIARRGSQAGSATRRSQQRTQRAHHAFSIGLAAAPEGIGPPPAEDRTTDAFRQRQRTLQLAEHRQDHQEMQEVLQRAIRLRITQMPSGLCAPQMPRTIDRKPPRPACSWR